MLADLIGALAAYPVVVLDGCDGTGKTTLAELLRDRRGHVVIHSGRTPDGTDLAERYRHLLATPGRIVLDRSFISELVYGPLFHGGSRITAAAAIDLARGVARRDGALVHLTGNPDAIMRRLRSRDGTAPPPARVSAIIDAYHAAFTLFDGSAPVITIDTASTDPLA